MSRVNFAAPALTFQDEAWMADAVCRGVDPSIFFPNSGDTGKRAKDICRQCPVAAQCLAYALKFTGPMGGTQPRTSDHGIYGGTTPWERDQIRRQRRGRAS